MLCIVTIVQGPNHSPHIDVAQVNPALSEVGMGPNLPQVIFKLFFVIFRLDYHNRS